MPYRNSRFKVYAPETYYHIYARGINKDCIFASKEDYSLFAYLLKKYLTPNFKEIKTVGNISAEVPVNSVSDQVALYCYSLLPNHFHLQLKNIKENGISNLMRRLLSVYSNYFNQKYERRGAMFEGTYRAVSITNDLQFIYLSRYIHLNALKAGLCKKVVDYKYSSLINYLYNKELPWLKLHPRLKEATEWGKIEQYAKDIEENPKQGIFFN